MPGTILPQQSTGIVGGTIARVERVERNTLPSPVSNPIIQMFSYPGPLASNVESPPWYAPAAGIIEIVRVSLTNSATSDHTIMLRLNGADVQQFTLSSGQKTSMNGAAISVPYGAYVTIKTVTVTDSNLTVEVRLR